MNTPTPSFATTSTLARAFGIDRRTLASRAAAAGLQPDARLTEGGEAAPLWSVARIAELKAALLRPADLLNKFRTLGCN
jgi:hypothetical protein